MKDAVFVHCGQPRDNVAVRLRPDPFRHHVGVEQKIHNWRSRGRSLTRSSLSPEPRKGEAAKNSARLPLRLVFRCHSSAETTTTGFLTFAGDRLWAVGEGAVNHLADRALASATAHVADRRRGGGC